LWQLDVVHRLTQRSVLDDQLQMHLGFTFEAQNRVGKRLAIRAQGAAQGLIAVKYRSKSERKNGGIAEAVAHYASMFNHRLLVEFPRHILADDYRQFATGIGKHLTVRNTVKTINGKRTTRANRS